MVFAKYSYDLCGFAVFPDVIWLILVYDAATIREGPYITNLLTETDRRSVVTTRSHLRMTVEVNYGMWSHANWVSQFSV